MGSRGKTRAASADRPCPVCGSDSWCAEQLDTLTLGCGTTRDGQPKVKDVTGAWICMRAANMGLVHAGRAAAAPVVNGMVAHGIWVGKRGQRDYNCARPGKSNGTYWYPVEYLDPQEEDGGTGGTNAAPRTSVRTLDPDAAKAMAEKEAADAARKAESDRRSLKGSREVWDGARSGENAPPLRAYLKARHIEPGLLPGGRVPACLRYAPVLKYKASDDPAVKAADPDDGKPGPGMVAAITNPDGTFGGLHRTYLALDGSPAKRKTGTQRRNSSNTLKPGAAIRLHDNPASDELWIGEGIETMLAVLVALEARRAIAIACGSDEQLPSVYAMLSTSGLTNMTLPVDDVGGVTRTPIRRVVWAADLDEVKKSVGDTPLPPEQWRRPGIAAALTGSERLAAGHAELEQRITIARPAWLPEALAAGEYDGLGELLPKADGSRRKSIDPDDALAVLATRTGDDAKAALVLGGALVDGLTPVEVVRKAIEDALREKATRDDEKKVKRGLRLVRDEGDEADGDEAGEGTRTKRGSGADGRRGKKSDDDDDGDEADGDEEGSKKDLGDGTGNNGPPYRLLPKCRYARARVVLDELYRPGGEWPREPGDHCMDPTWKKNVRARLADANGRWLVTYWVEGDQWYVYEQGSYRPVKAMEIEARVGDYLATFKSMTEKKKIKAAGLSTASVRDVLEAMKSEVMVRADALPMWAPETFDASGIPLWHTVRRGGRAEGPAVVPTASGLIDVEQLKGRKLVVYPLTPRFVSVHVLPHQLPLDELARAIEADSDGEERLCNLAAKYAPEWMKQVAIQSEDDENWHRGLQQVFGMLLTNDMKFCTGTLLVGVSGTFKGTTLAALRTCHHKQNIAVASYDEITRPFAAATWLGKGVLLIDELGAGRHSDKAATAQRVKGLIAGEPINVDLKHKDALGTYDHTLRLVMTSDRMPEFIDPAGAMRRRLAIFVCTKNYVGDPDVNIRERIKGEGLGILVWAIGGLIDLYKVGRVLMPESGRDYLNRLVRDSSKPTAFMEDCLVVDRRSAVDANLLYDMYKAWCTWNGMECPQRAKVFEGFAAIVDRMARMTLDAFVKRYAPTSQVQTTDELGRPRKVIVGLRPRLRREGATPGTTALVIDRGTVFRAPPSVDDRSPWVRGKDEVDVMDFDPSPNADPSDEIPY